MFFFIIRWLGLRYATAAAEDWVMVNVPHVRAADTALRDWTIRARAATEQTLLAAATRIDELLPELTLFPKRVWSACGRIAIHMARSAWQVWEALPDLSAVLLFLANTSLTAASITVVGAAELYEQAPTRSEVICVTSEAVLFAAAIVPAVGSSWGSQRSQIRPDAAGSPGVPMGEAVPPTSCIICLDAPRTHALTPCGHFSFCEACVTEWMGRVSSDACACPVCKQIATGILRVFT